MPVESRSKHLAHPPAAKCPLLGAECGEQHDLNYRLNNVNSWERSLVTPMHLHYKLMSISGWEKDVKKRF